MGERDMTRTATRPRTWLAVLSVALIGAGCTPMDDVISSIFGRSMREQPSFNPYENPRPAPEGSVPFASGNFPASPGQVNLGGPEGQIPPPAVTPFMVLQSDPAVTGLENPVPPDAESLQRGQEMYNRTCLPCHGPSGAGNGPVTAAGVPAFSIVEGEALDRTDGYLYSIIRVGRGAMPAYGHQITHYDRWHVVNYVLQLQGRLPGAGDATGADDGPLEN
jgi:mono/diheme cytochrome c family protein